MELRILVYVLLSIITHSLYAIPAFRGLFHHLQGDKTSITLRVIGDESCHFIITIDSIPVILGNDNSYYYAAIEGHDIVSTGLLAHNQELRNESERLICSSISLNEIYNNLGYGVKTSCKLAKTYSSSVKKNNRNNYQGEKRGLVILVNFANKKMTGNDPNKDFENMFNLHNYSEDNHVGSVHDYFYDQSYGKFDISFDVVGPINLSRNYGYYGQNISNVSGDKYAGSMVIEACNAIDNQIDFKNYDWNNDGMVETVFVVYAGYGENACLDASTIWPHKSSLSGRTSVGDGNGAITLDGVTIDVYACSSELAGSTGVSKNGIGTACHEFSHCLGLPDLYDTDYSGAFGMNKWDVMDAGSYSGPNGRGEVPYGYSAFERAYAGWLELEELEKESWYALQPLNDYAHAYILSNDANENEFFIFENHQPQKWFSFVGKHTDLHGMMITHVDYDEKAWANNNVNGVSSHMRESIVPADKSYGTYYSSDKSYYVSESDYRGDLFPGNKDINRFSSKSHESHGGKLFNKNGNGNYYLNVTIDNITENNGVISFSVANNLKTPKNINASRNGDKLNIHWDEVAGADKYIIEVSRIISYLPSKIENEIIEDVVGTSCSLDYLACRQCSVRVKAKNEFVSSEWSEFVKSTNDTDGINDIENDISTHREYYMLNGTEAYMPRTNGIYIHKEKNLTTKIYIR